MIPTVCVKARDLLKDGRAADVAMPNVYMQIAHWWKGGKCQVSRAMHVALLARSAFGRVLIGLHLLRI